MVKVSAIRGGLIALFLMCFASVAQAQTYEGGWSYTPQGGGWAEELWLGDGNNYGLHMRGTDRYCGQPGSAYSTMRNVLLGTRGFGAEYITWWIADSCRDGYVRVCLRNQLGQSACSTYADYGWGPRP